MLKPNDVEVEASKGDVKVGAKFTGPQAWVGAIAVLVLLGLGTVLVLREGGFL